MIKRRNGTKKDTLINTIIDYEFEMFDKVQGMQGRAGCQDDFDTFYVMRFAQHCIFSEETLNSYILDLRDAVDKGINLITCKYAYMMEDTDKEYYESNLKMYLPVIDREKASYILTITRRFERGYRELRDLYPYILQSGRGLPANSEIGALAYLSCELKTYSKRTLRLIERDCDDMESSFINPVKLLYINIASFYGLRSLEEFEGILKNNNDN